MTAQTYPFTHYYLRVPGEHASTWVPVRIGASIAPATWATEQAAFDFAVNEAEFPTFRVIAVTESIVGEQG